MPAGTPYSAKNAKARVNGNVLFNVNWTVTPESDLLDTSNKEGGGKKDYIAGLSGVKVHVEGWFDVGANMYDSPLSIFDGAELNNVFLYLGADTSGPGWFFPKIIVGPAPMMADVHDLIKYTFDANGKGTWSYPSGNL